MFSLQLPKILTSRLMRPLAMLAIAALVAPGTVMAASNWTSVGSTGVVDELCSHFAVQMNGPEARLTPGVLFSCTLRYQVTDTNPGTTANKVLRAHISDATAVGGDHVVVRLMEYDRNTGVPTAPPMVVIDSNTTAASAPISSAAFPNLKLYRSATAFTCPGTTPITLNFSAKSYWIEVDLIPGPIPSLTAPAINMVGFVC